MCLGMRGEVYHHANTFVSVNNDRKSSYNNKQHPTSVLNIDHPIPSDQLNKHTTLATAQMFTKHTPQPTTPTHHMTRHDVATFLSSVFQHMFAPVSCQTCTTSPQSPCLHHEQDEEDLRARYRAQELKHPLYNERVLLEDDAEDGTPLCREAEIAKWPTCEVLQRTPSLGERRRRLSFRES